MPYKRVKGWAWKSYWIVGGVFSLLIVPPLAAYLTIHNFPAIISSAGSGVKLFTYLIGLPLWQ